MLPKRHEKEKEKIWYEQQDDDDDDDEVELSSQKNLDDLISDNNNDTDQHDRTTSLHGTSSSSSDRVSVADIAHKQVSCNLSVHPPNTQSNYRLYLDDAPYYLEKFKVVNEDCIGKKLFKNMKFYGSSEEIWNFEYFFKILGMKE